MNALIKYLNLAGICAIALLSCQQWKINSQLTARSIDQQKVIVQQSTDLQSQKATLLQNTADLDDLRHRLMLAEAQLKKTEAVLSATQLERDQLKIVRDRLLAAVSARDQVLKQQGDVIHNLAQARNDAIARFNDLVTKYNSIAAQH